MRRSLFAFALVLPLLSLDAQIIRGRVVDADAKPVAAARVQVVLADRSPLDFAQQQSVLTSEDGRYEVAAPSFDEADRATVAITLPAHATVRSAPFHIGSGDQRIDVALPRFEAITVRVADRAGKPLPKARVAFAETVARRDPEALLLARFESHTTRTDDAGEAMLYLVPGVWDFAVVAEGFQATTLAERTIKRSATIDVALEPAVSIRGRVHRKGTGVEDVEVSLLEGKRRSRNKETIVTDADGAFEIPGLAAGRPVVLRQVGEHALGAQPLLRQAERQHRIDAGGRDTLPAGVWRGVIGERPSSFGLALLELGDRPLQLIGIDHRDRRPAEGAGRRRAHVDGGAAARALHALDVAPELGHFRRRQIAHEVLGAQEGAEGHVAAVALGAAKGFEGGGPLLVQLSDQEGLAARALLALTQRPVGLGHRLAHLLEQRERGARRQLMALHLVEPDAVAPGTEVQGHLAAVVAVEGGLPHAAATRRAGHAPKYSRPMSCEPTRCRYA